MMSVKDWVLSQLVSKSLASSRPLAASDSFLSEGPPDQELDDQVADTSQTSDDNLDNENLHCSREVVESSLQSTHSINPKKWDPLTKIENLQVKFLRVLQRFGLSHDNHMVAKVLYRIHLATLIRAGESDLKRANLKFDKARAVAAEQEVSGRPQLDFSLKILVLGKTGVGKSSTINSIFDQTKARTNAFQPATNHVQEIIGTVNGIKICFIDTPGLLPSSPTTVRKNRKILHSIKRFIRRSPPDIVLFFERLDLITMGYSDFPLLRLISEVFGPAIWFNAILVMTHSSSSLPEGPTGYPVSYESYVTQCKDVVQHYIHQAVADTKLENPVLLVENDPHCRTNHTGDKILPNGQVWRSEFLLLCACMKVLNDVNTILEFQGSLQLGPPSKGRQPSLPHLLSSFLKRRAQLNPNGEDSDMDGIWHLDKEEEDEYDQLPPIRILTKAQFQKLSKSQKKDYLDELDYRETLYLKKQMKEEYRRRKEKKLSESRTEVPDNNDDDENRPPEAVQLPDMAVPPSFDSDCTVHRYRCVVTSDQWLARPVLDPHGWDHDVGFDGVNLETAAEVKKNLFAFISGQVSKDKQDFSIQSECAAAYVDDPRGATYGVGFDVQSAGKELTCTVHSSAKLKTLKQNITECGVSVTSYGNNYFVGAKVEDSISIGKRLKFVMNAGRMAGLGQAAVGGNFEAILRGKDYPVRDDKVSLTMTVLSLKKETVLGGTLESDFRLSRGTRMSVKASLNSRNMGQVCVKTSSSDHMEIALLSVITVFRALTRRRANDDESIE